MKRVRFLGVTVLNKPGKVLVNGEVNGGRQ